MEEENKKEKNDWKIIKIFETHNKNGG